MICNGHFLPDDPFEMYHSKWWDERDRAYAPDRHNWLLKRNRHRTGYRARQHAVQIWTAYMGRIHITLTRKPA